MRKLLLLFFLLPTLVFARQTEVDSLAAALATAKTASERVLLHCALSKKYALSDIPKATQHALAAEKLAAQVNDLAGLATALNQRGHLHLVMGEFDKSLNQFYQALKLAQQTQDTALLVSTYCNLGVLNNKTKDSKRALNNYLTAARLATKTNNQAGLSKIYNNMGGIYADQKDYRKALGYYEKAATFQDSLKDTRVQAVILLNTGEMYVKLNQPAKGRQYLFKALQLDQQIQNKMNMTVTLGMIAESYLAEKQFNKALSYAHQSLDLATETGSSKKISASAKLLQNIYEPLQNFEQAYKYQSLYAEHQEKLDAERQNRAAAEITARFDNERRDLETQKLRAEKESQLAKIEHQRIILGLCITFLVLTLMVVVELVLRRRRLKSTNLELKKASVQLQSQKEEILKQAAALQKQNELLEQHNHFKSKVFSIVSHDLRSPFTTIQGVLELGQGSRMTEQDMNRIFGLLSKDVDVVLEMLNNILVWSGNQMEGETLQIKPVNVFELAEDCLQLVSDKATQKAVLIENLVEPNTAVWADRERLAFVFRNLLMNAIKFSFAANKVTLSTQEADGQLIIKVTDTGKGISPKNLDKLFSNVRFTTLGTSHEVGTGLGLMLCKELLESMDGSISVESVEGEGTVFSVQLPTTFAQKVVEKEDSALVYL